MRRLVPTNTWVRLALVPVLVFLALATDRNYLADFWHHLARGRAIRAEGRLVDEDRFTFTVASQPLRDVNWLSQVAYDALFERGGLELVRAANALTLAAVFALLVWHCRRRSGALGVATAVGVLTFFGLWNVLTIRPQTFSLLLFVALYAVLDQSTREGQRAAGLIPAVGPRPDGGDQPRRSPESSFGRWGGRLWLAPPILALWANLHGAFPAGLLLIGCFLLAAAWQAWRRGELARDARTRALAVCLAASAAATLVNPYGWGVWQYVGLTANTAAARRIDEWVPPSLDQWIGVAFFVSLPLLLGLFIASRRRPSARDVCLIACFLPLACGSVRMVAWWLLAIAPLLAERLAAVLARRGYTAATDEGPSAGAAVVFGAMALAVVFCLPGLRDFNPLLRVSRQGPLVEDDLEVIRQRLRARGRVFSRFEWGEYLSWSGAPTLKVFMDARIEIYPDAVWKEYTAVTCGRPGWEAILDGYAVDYLVLDAHYHARTGLLDRVERSPAWRPAFRSRDAVLYVRAASGGSLASGAASARR